MKVRLLKRRVVKELWDSVRSNLEKYRSGTFSHLANDPSAYLELETSIDEQALHAIAGDQTDLKNCLRIFDALGTLPPHIARDPRLWFYLTHTELLEYTRARWPIPASDGDAVRFIRRHFFGSGSRGVERENAVSRLWWMSHICNRVSNMELERALEAFLYKSDVRASIIERPSTSQTVSVLSGVLGALSKSLRHNQRLYERDRFRQAMKELNLLGGTMLLEVLPDAEVQNIVSSVMGKYQA